MLTITYSKHLDSSDITSIYVLQDILISKLDMLYLCWKTCIHSVFVFWVSVLLTMNYTYFFMLIFAHFCWKRLLPPNIRRNWRWRYLTKPKLQFNKGLFWKCQQAFPSQTRHRKQNRGKQVIGNTVGILRYTSSYHTY